MTPTLPLTRELVLIGGGHTHALVLRRWGMRPLPGTRLTLINPGPTAPYTGMLPGFVAGHYDRDDLEIDLMRLARFAAARLILGEAEGIDRENRKIQISGRADVSYDIASIDIGITSDLPMLPGFIEFGVPAKPLGTFASAWSAYRDRAGPAAIVVIGAGVGGVELTLAMAHAMAERSRPADITVIDRTRALDGLHPPARIALLERCRAMNVRVLEDTEVTEVTSDGVHLASGRILQADFTVGVAGARPYRWLETTGLDLQDGFLAVDAALRTSDPAIYATGDCAHFTPAPRPKAGVFAVRAAPVLAHNLRADLAGAARKRFQPQEDYLKLISLGDKSAVGEKWGLVAQGGYVWQLKDRIDRKFMDRLADLKPMPLPAAPRDAAQGLRAAMAAQPLCGGCGAKVASGTLSAALDRLDMPQRDDVETGPGDDAAVLKFGRQRQVITTDHLRAFIDDPYRLAQISAVHAMGDVWAMGAAPQAALASIILPRMQDAMLAGWLDEIMAGAARAFRAEGASIVGGHTTQGSELTIGFTVTGKVTGAPRTLAGAKPGDVLVLTRPIGSGVLLAGEMQLAARGVDVAACLDEMARSQAAAAQALAKARAMTDVTGFGLAGHLLSLCDASGVAANLSLADIPFYAGAEDLAAMEIQSTLYAGNRAAADRVTVPDGAQGDLLFDPQTSGGLLAALPPSAVKDAIAALDGRGCVIGEIADGAPGVSVT